jgi:exonuclease SbcD
MRVLEGSLADLLALGQQDSRADDYLLIRLTDSHAILDLMTKLRQVYPNLLHIERPGLLARSETLAVNRERLQKGELAMFGDFFQQVTERELSEQQTKIIAESLDQLHREQR